MDNGVERTGDRARESISLGLFHGSYCAFVCELFPSHVRSTGMAIGYNFAVMIFGGFAGAIATLLIKITDNKLAVVFTACSAA
jgi:MHS family proline/betaine transporter-like MFS transporter